MNISIKVSFNLDRFSSKISHTNEKIRREGQLVAGIERYLKAQ